MKKAIWLSVIVAVLVIGAIVAVVVSMLFIAKGGLTKVLPPNPVVVSTRTSTANSSLTDFCQTITADIRNDGGNGDIVIEMKYSEGAQTWTKSKREGFTANETKIISIDFTEATLSGEGRYEITAR